MKITRNQILLSLGLFIAISVTAVLVFSPPNKKVKNPLRIDNADFKELIVKEGDNYFLAYEYTTREHRGGFLIGNSKVDLNPFINKVVKTNRDYSRVPQGGLQPIMTNQQCIVEECHFISKNNPEQQFEVIDINTLEEAK